MNNPGYTPATPYYLFSEREFLLGVNSLRKAMGSRFNDFSVAYSLKTNPCPQVLQAARQAGVLAEVVSADEYQLALEASFSAANIIYNGPLKTPDTFRHALEGGAMVNIECWREIDWLEAMSPSRCYEVGIRINITMAEVSPRDALIEQDPSRFGFSNSSGDLAHALQRLRAMNHVRIAGLHLHRSTQNRAPHFYRALARYARMLIHEFGLTLKYIDFGGGFNHITPNKSTFSDYAKALHQGLGDDLSPLPCIILEPGHALVSRSMTLVGTVIDVKTAPDGSRTVTTDISRIDIDPLFKHNDHQKVIHYGSSDQTQAQRPIIACQRVCGCTCMEFDRLFTLRQQPELRPGDTITLPCAGAYTRCLTPLFIRHIPPVVAQ